MKETSVKSVAKQSIFFFIGNEDNNLTLTYNHLLHICILILHITHF
jgi:hypothetical protein